MSRNGCLYLNVSFLFCTCHDFHRCLRGYCGFHSTDKWMNLNSWWYLLAIPTIRGILTVLLQIALNFCCMLILKVGDFSCSPYIHRMPHIWRTFLGRKWQLLVSCQSFYSKRKEQIIQTPQKIMMDLGINMPDQRRWEGRWSVNNSLHLSYRY